MLLSTILAILTSLRAVPLHATSIDANRTLSQDAEGNSAFTQEAAIIVATNLSQTVTPGSFEDYLRKGTRSSGAPEVPRLLMTIMIKPFLKESSKDPADFIAIKLHYDIRGRRCKYNWNTQSRQRLLNWDDGGAAYPWHSFDGMEEFWDEDISFHQMSLAQAMIKIAGSGFDRSWTDIQIAKFRSKYRGRHPELFYAFYESGLNGKCIYVSMLSGSVWMSDSPNKISERIAGPTSVGAMIDSPTTDGVNMMDVREVV